MIPDLGVWVCAAHQLERVNALGSEDVTEAELPATEVLVESEVGRVGIYALRGVGVQGARVDVGAVGQFRRVGREELLAYGPGGVVGALAVGRVDQQGGASVGQGD